MDIKFRDYPVSVNNPQFVYSSAGANWGLPYEQIRTGSNSYARGVELFAHKKKARFVPKLQRCFSPKL